MRRIDSVRRQDETGGVEIGGGESELAPEFVPFHHYGREGIGAAQHLTGSVKIPRANGFPDAGAADDLAVERHSRDAVDGELKFRTERFQDRHVAAALVAEYEIRADADALEATEVARELADEGRARLLAECSVEAKDQQGVRTERRHGAEFLRGRIDQRRHAIRGDDGAGVAIECEHHGERVVLAGVGDGLPDDLLVPEMHPVKDPNREADFPGTGLKFARVLNDLHGAKCSVGLDKCSKFFTDGRGMHAGWVRRVRWSDEGREAGRPPSATIPSARLRGIILWRDLRVCRRVLTEVNADGRAALR